MPLGITLGYGGVGFGNQVQGNQFWNVAIATAVDKDLSSTPSMGCPATPAATANDQIGLNVSDYASAGDVVAYAATAPISITAISQANPAVVTYTGTDPSNNNVYVISGVYGMLQMNGQLCTIGSVNTTAKTFNCTGINSTSYTAFLSAPSGAPGAAKAYLIFSSGTTAAYAPPAVLQIAPRTVASGALALATSSISSGTCQAVTAGSVNSVAAAGVLTSDVISFTPNGSIKAVTGYAPGTNGGLTITAYPTAGDVNFDVCNWTASSVTPGAVTLNWRVER